MQTLTTLAELDRKLEECRLASANSDDALRAIFSAFEGQFALDHPADPFGDDYRLFQMALYERFAGRPYRVTHESTPLEVERSAARPFPFSTGSAATAGQHLGAVAFLLRSLRLHPGSRFLEFGPGWGNTTIALAQLGFAVTAVDVDPGFCELLRLRGRRAGVEIEVVNADFFWAEQVTVPFDAVIFFECFHHCDDHLRLLRSLHAALRPEGHVYFGAEPILEEYPVPWGLRMDGEALWAIRHHGWLELGFRESYFREALARTGWLGRQTRSVDLPWISVWEARAPAAGPLTIEASDARVGTLTGRKVDGRIEVAAESDGYALYGPYVPLPPGTYRGTIEFAAGAEMAGGLALDACAERGVTVFARVVLDVEAARLTGRASLDFDLPGPVDDLELQLSVSRGAVATILRMTIEERGRSAAS